MKYYPHHIGDFDRATRHLTRIERSVYRDLIELYYDTEQQLPLDLGILCRKIIARTDEERTAVEQALNEFFTKTEQGWYHDRCEAEIAAYHANTSQKSLAGKASAAKRAQKRQQALNGRSTGDQRASNGSATNQEPATNNQEPEETTSAAAPENGDRREGSLELVGEVLATESAKRVPSLEHQMGVVFEHWKLVMGSSRSVFDDKRKGQIKKAIKMGYSVEDLCAAIDGCMKSDFHMARGEYAGKIKHNGLDLILRDANKIDQFITIGRSPRVATPTAPARPGAAPTTMMRPNDQDYSSSAAAAARTKQQWGIQADGNLDF